MKKFLALAVVTAFALAGTALAGDEKKMEKKDWAKGTITAWDETTKTFKVKDEAGKEWTFTMTDKTMVHGKGMTGEMTKVKFTTEADGKNMATHVFVGKEEMAKAEKKEMEKAATHD